MERYIAHAVEAILRNEDWETELYQFYQVNSPRFMNFIVLYHQHTNNENNMDTGFDLQMIVVHKEFIQIVENKLSVLLLNMNVTTADFIQSMKLNLESNDETVCRLYKLIYMYDDFIEFSTMMELKYKEIYVHNNNNNNNNIVKSIIQTNNMIKICRVLWDIENIPVINKDGGIHTVTKLHTFLKYNNMMGIGIDTRITAFFNPYNNSISKKVIEELNKASVELVCTSSKREDADRKLGMRINQEMLILNPAITTFIVISSDQDFRQHIQLLTNNGFQVIVIHNIIATTVSIDNLTIVQQQYTQWKAAIEMYASQSYVWNDIMNISSSNTTTTNTGTEVTSSTSIIATLNQHHENHVIKSSNEQNRPNENNQLLNSTSKQTISYSFNNAHHELLNHNKTNLIHNTHLQQQEQQQIQHYQGRQIERDLQREALSVGWRIAMCLRWKSAFGFLLVDISQPTVEETFTIPFISSNNDNTNNYYYNNNNDINNNDNNNDNSNNNNAVGSQHGANDDPDKNNISFITTIQERPVKSIPKHMQINKHDKNNINTVKVYIHNSALSYKPDTQRMLQTGEYVLAYVQLANKGPKAVIVKDLLYHSYN